MLPFHKRARANSIMEIGSEELEAVELPRVRPPQAHLGVRPAAYAQRPSSVPMFPQNQERSNRYDNYDAEEMTVVRMDKRVSTSPPPRVHVESTRIPYNPPPRFDESESRRPAYGRSVDRDDEPTQMYGSRPLLSMQRQTPRSVIVDQTSEVPPPPSSRVLPEVPRSAVAVDAASSAHVHAVDLSMTANLSGSTDISKLRRPTFGWATALVAVGVFAGIVTAFVARGEGLATAAAFIDPSHQATADVAKAGANLGAQPQQIQAQPQTQALMPGAGAIQVQSKPAVPSCDANAVPAPKAEAKEVAKVEAAPVVAKVERVVEVKPVVHTTYVAPVVHHVEAAPQQPVVVAQAAPPTAITKPVAKAVSSSGSHRASGNDMESANAADALAKAQLEAALSR